MLTRHTFNRCQVPATVASTMPIAKSGQVGIHTLASSDEGPALMRQVRVQLNAGEEAVEAWTSPGVSGGSVVRLEQIAKSLWTSTTRFRSASLMTRSRIRPRARNHVVAELMTANSSVPFSLSLVFTKT